MHAGLAVAGSALMVMVNDVAAVRALTVGCTMFVLHVTPSLVPRLRLAPRPRKRRRPPHPARCGRRPLLGWKNRP